MDNLIYITEDEENIRELLKCTLESFGYSAETFESGEDLFKGLEEKTPQLVILDLMLPGISGLDILKKMKETGKYKNIPVIILTAKNSEIDKVAGLDIGADDYITKPFGILELMARVRVVLRRNEKTSEEILNIKDLFINLKKHEVSKHGEIISLTLKEYELLKILMENCDKVMERDKLLNIIWGVDFIGETRTLDMHIKSLRKKIGDNIEEPVYIKTVRGVGYIFLS